MWHLIPCKSAQFAKSAVSEVLLVFFLIVGIVEPVFAQDQDGEKPAFKLPEVTIIGHDESRLAPLERPSTAPSSYEKPIKEIEPRAKREGFKWTMTMGYGGFDTFYYDIAHWGRISRYLGKGANRLFGDSLNYQTSILIKRTDWDRPNSSEITYRPTFNLFLPIDDFRDCSLDGIYFAKEMELPGPTNSPTPSALRNVDNFNLSVISNYKSSGTDRFYIETYLDCSKIDENLDRADYNNRLFKVGISYHKDSLTSGVNISSNKLKDKYDQLLGSLYLKNNSIILSPNLSLAAGITIDAQENFGWRINPEAIFLHKINETTTCRVSGRRKFEVANFSDLYLNDNFVEVNPQCLNPLRSWECEFGIDCWMSHNLRGDFALFRRDIKDCLIWDDADNNGLYRPINITKAWLFGIRLRMDYYLTDCFSQYLKYTYNDVHNKDNSIENLPYYPEHRFQMGLSYWSKNGFRVDLTGEYTGRQYYDKNVKLTMPSYFLVNSRLSYELNENLSLFIMVDNLFNDGFEIRKNYPGLGRNILGGIKLKF